MKKSLLLIITAIAMSTLLYSQEKVATFKDGTRVTYELANDQPDGVRKNTFLLGSHLIGGSVQLLEFEHFRKNDFLLHAGIGLVNFDIGGIYFLGSKVVVKNTKLKLKSEGYQVETVYLVKEKLKGVRYHGIHADYNFHQIGLLSSSETGTIHEISLGYAIHRVRNYGLHVKSEGIKPISMDRSASLYMDLLYFPIVEFTNSNDENQQISSLGFRIYYKGRVNNAGRFPLGLHYSIGLESSPIKTISPVGGFGINYSFTK